MVACLDSVWWLKLLPVNAYHFAVSVRLLLNVAPLWVSGDSPQITSISPCSNYTNVHPVPLTAPSLGLFTSSQSLTTLTIHIQEFTCLAFFFDTSTLENETTTLP